MPEIQNIPTTQYIGPRIIPHLWDPILWDASTQYDALAVVQYEGVPYIARYVPPQGTLPTDTDYWVRWADFNAQMAQLQQTVETFRDDIDTLGAIVPRSAFSSTNTVQKAINDEATARQQAVSAEATARQQAVSAEATARTTADTALGNRITSEANAREAADTALGNRITSEANAREVADTALGNRITSNETLLSSLNRTELVIFGDSWAATSVSDNVWMGYLRNATGLNLHNYAINGAHQSDPNTNLQAQASAFIADTSFDKSKIKSVILVYGVNDQWTYPVSYTTCAASIKQLCETITPALPTGAQILHLFNFTYGFASNSPVTQAEYYNYTSTIVKRSTTRYQSLWLYPYFTVYDMNKANYFHLNESGQRQKLLRIIISALSNGYREELPQYRGLISSSKYPGYTLEIECISTVKDTTIRGVHHLESASAFQPSIILSQDTILVFPMKIECVRMPLLATSGYTQLALSASGQPSGHVDALVNTIGSAGYFGPDPNFAAYPANIPFQVSFPHPITN